MRITTESSEELANMLNERMLKKQGGQNQRLAIMLGWLTNIKNRPVAVNIPSKDRSLYSQKNYEYLLYAPFNVSNKCCNIFKKNIAHKYNHKNKMYPMLASMACESRLRTQKWLDNGCNGFDLSEPVSNPMSFWVENDVLLYIKLNNLPIASVYGEVVEDYQSQGQCEGQISFADMGLFDKQPIYKTTGKDRSGCIACGFGITYDSRPNRLEQIDMYSNWKIRDWILRGGSFTSEGVWQPDNRGLGFWFVYEYLNVVGHTNIFIPEIDRYIKEFGTSETERYLRMGR